MCGIYRGKEPLKQAGLNPDWPFLGNSVGFHEGHGGCGVLLGQGLQPFQILISMEELVAAASARAQRGQDRGAAGSQGLWGGMGLPGEFSPLNLPWVWDLGIKWTLQAVNSVKFLPPSSSTAVPPGTSHFLGHDCPKLCPNPTALPK